MSTRTPNRITSLALAVALAASGCAGVVRPSETTWRPIVDLAAPSTPSGQPEQLEIDVSQCNQFALQVDRDKAAANGAAAGAVIGALLGAALGLRGSSLVAVSAYGAAAGGVRNAYVADYANLSQYQVVQRCLAGRGYSVIN